MKTLWARLVIYASLGIMYFTGRVPNEEHQTYLDKLLKDLGGGS